MQRQSHMHTNLAVNIGGLPSQEHIDPAVRLRIARWLLWYRLRKGEQFPRDADFAAHVGIKPSHLSNVLTYARSGGERGRSPGLEVVLKLSSAASRSTDEILRDPPPTAGSSPPQEHTPGPAAAPQAHRHPGGRRSGGGGR
jgi:hypothetical protein